MRGHLRLLILSFEDNTLRQYFKKCSSNSARILVMYISANTHSRSCGFHKYIHDSRLLLTRKILKQRAPSGYVEVITSKFLRHHHSLMKRYGVMVTMCSPDWTIAHLALNNNRSIPVRVAKVTHRCIYIYT